MAVKTDMRSESAEWEVIVIGAGAAGLLAATRAAERGRRTLLLEKNNKVGVKILISGGTRCNITQATDRRGIIETFGRNGRFLHSPLSILGPDELLALVNAEGVPTKIEPSGKVFPASDKAKDVADALERRLRRTRCSIALEEPVMDFDVVENGFKVETSRRELLTSKLIVTTGGSSFPGSGTTGDGYPWARRLGHSIVHTVPALVPLTTDEEWVKRLKGVTLPDVLLRLTDSPQAVPKKKQISQRGSFLFTHFGVSGPTVLNISREVTRHADPTSLFLNCDLLPDCPREELDTTLQQTLRADGRKQVIAPLTTFVPRRLAEEILGLLTIPLEKRAADINRDERYSIVSHLKNLVIPISGTMGFKKAEVTAGGISLKEVDSRDMQSKLVPNLYFAGEILDLDGLIGGYNFQAAFSTGWLAGESV